MLIDINLLRETPVVLLQEHPLRNGKSCFTLELQTQTTAPAAPAEGLLLTLSAETLDRLYGVLQGHYKAKADALLAGAGGGPKDKESQ